MWDRAEPRDFTLRTLSGLGGGGSG
jgi:hypothetical protein